MTIIHIQGHDVNSGGEIYNGVWTLSRIVSGTYEVLFTKVAEGDLPIVWSSVNELVFQNSLIDYTVTFPDTSDDDKTTFASTLEGLIATAIATTGATITVTYDASVDGFVFSQTVDATTGDAAMLIRWEASSMAEIFDVDTTADASYNLKTSGDYTANARNINGRPSVLELHIDEVVNLGANTNAGNPDLVLAVDDVVSTGQQVTLPAGTVELTMQVYRPNVASSPVPLINEWDVVLSKC